MWGGGVWWVERVNELSHLNPWVTFDFIAVFCRVCVRSNCKNNTWHTRRRNEGLHPSDTSVINSNVFKRP